MDGQLFQSPIIYKIKLKIEVSESGNRHNYELYVGKGLMVKEGNQYFFSTQTSIRPKDREIALSDLDSSFKDINLVIDTFITNNDPRIFELYIHISFEELSDSHIQKKNISIEELHQILDNIEYETLKTTESYQSKSCTIL